MTKLFAVIGNPIAHSRSPQMQQAAFDEVGVDAVYFRVLAASAGEIFSAADELGLCGMSVTSPFKEEVANAVDVKDEKVKLLNACNTVVFENGKSFGFNTDSDGVVGALKDCGAQIAGKKAVVLGAGGAAKAAILALTKEGASVVCANRTLEKAQEAAETFGCSACSTGEEDLRKALEGASIVVSCVTTHERVVPKELLRSEMVVLDANYSADSKIVADAKEAGCKIAHPLGWLLFQGTTAFEKFSGKAAPLEVMRGAAFESYPDARQRRKIALVGFMGSGKSTVGKELAQMSGLGFVETDALIVKDARKSIPEIFEQEGEERFREMETNALKEAVKRESCALSCGGGIVLREENAHLLQKECFVVWLFASAKEALGRVKDDASRPLLNRPDREEAARKILNARIPMYARACNIMINTEGKTPQEIAQMIMKEVGIEKT